MTDRTKTILLEIACLLVIAGSVAAIAVPKMDDVKRRDAAAGVLADLERMRYAVFSFYSDSAYFPEEVPGRAIPPGLSAYLPRGFAPERSYGTIAYKNWPGGARPASTSDSLTGAPSQPSPAKAGAEDVSTSNIVGAVIIATDLKVVGTAAAQSPRTARFLMGNRYTFLFFGT